MAPSEGFCAPQTRQGRKTLHVSRPYIETALGSLSIDPEHIAESRRFGNQVANELERWKLGRASSDRGRICKREAEQMWRAEFGNRPLNSLGRYRRDGAQ